MKRYKRPKTKSYHRKKVRVTNSKKEKKDNSFFDTTFEKMERDLNERSLLPVAIVAFDDENYQLRFLRYQLGTLDYISDKIDSLRVYGSQWGESSMFRVDTVMLKGLSRLRKKENRKSEESTKDKMPPKKGFLKFGKKEKK